MGEKKTRLGEGVAFGCMGLPEIHAVGRCSLAFNGCDYLVAQTLSVDGGQQTS